MRIAISGQVFLNGTPLERGFIRHAEIVVGGELRFVMQATPQHALGDGRARPALFDDWLFGGEIGRPQSIG